MRTLTALALLLLAARAAADAPVPDARAAVAVRLERLTPAQAQRLCGTRALFLVKVDFEVGMSLKGGRVYVCHAPGRGVAVLHLRAGSLRKGAVAVVEANLAIRGRWQGADYRLLDAVRKD